MIRPVAMFGALLLAGVLSPAAATQPAVTATETEVRFANDKLEVCFDRQNGRWLALYDRVRQQEVMSDGKQLDSTVITTGGRPATPGTRGPLTGTQTIGPRLELSGWRTESSAGTVWLILETVEGDWQVAQAYGMSAADDTVTRRVRLTWKGAHETSLRWVDLRTPYLPASGNAILEAPGYPVIPHQQLDRLPAGPWPELDKSSAPANRAGLLVFRRGDSNLLVWGFDKEIPSQMSVNGGERGVWVSQRLLSSCRVHSGQTVEVGTQYVRLDRGDFYLSLKRFQHFWDAAGIRLIGSTPPWGRDARIYEAQIGPNRWAGKPYDPYPDIADLASDLPRIAALGFNIVELMPHQVYPDYSVHDYLDIDTQYAPERELRKMITRAHELGLKVLLDVVMHGVIDKRTPKIVGRFDVHPYIIGHPDWFSYNEDGSMAKTYTWAFDHASPSFQDFIVRVHEEYVRRLDVDGFREDALTWNSFPNWAKDLSRPGYESFFASAPMFDKVRQRLRSLKPEILFYTETQGPLYETCFDLSYNYDEQPFYQALLPLLSRRGYVAGHPLPRKITAREMAEWLQMRRLAFPAGWRKVHHVDSHDSYTWGGLGMFRKEAFGVEGARLLFAFCVFLDGGIMNYAGAETGSEEFYRKVLAIRESMPALREGTCDYLAVCPSNDRVLAPLRRLGSHWALPVLSFSAEPIRTVLPLDTLRLKPQGTYTLTELFSGAERVGKGKELSRLAVELPPYAVQIWTARQEKTP